MGELIAGAFASAASGGLLGVFGGLLRQGLDWVKRRSELAQELAILQERNRHEAEMRDKDREMLRLEGEGKVKLATVEGDALIEKARMEAIGASFAADRATFATGEAAANSKWFIAVDVVRGMIRPTITLLFDLALFVIWGVLVYLMWDELAKLLAARDPAITRPLLEHFWEITKAIIFLATTATGYWFVARPGSEARNG